jgi:hypothetical protein
MGNLALIIWRVGADICVMSELHAIAVAWLYILQRALNILSIQLCSWLGIEFEVDSSSLHICEDFLFVCS